MSYIDDPAEFGYSDRRPFRVKCDQCGETWSLTYKSAKKNEKKNGGQHICHTCKGCPPKPQWLSSFWDKTRRKEHSERVRNSEEYQRAIEKRDTSGPNNGMYGKRASEQTRQKMSKSRMGKIGPKATAWKGGTHSFVRRVKGIIHTRFHWYARVYQRDGWACQQCGSKKDIDAHHKDPIVSIIARLVLGKQFSTDEEKIEWLVCQPEIVDDGLENGITLCRKCHAKLHRCWGSKTNP